MHHQSYTIQCICRQGESKLQAGHANNLSPSLPQAHLALRPFCLLLSLLLLPAAALAVAAITAGLSQQQGETRHARRGGGGSLLLLRVLAVAAGGPPLRAAVAPAGCRRCGGAAPADLALQLALDGRLNLLLRVGKRVGGGGSVRRGG